MSSLIIPRYLFMDVSGNVYVMRVCVVVFCEGLCLSVCLSVCLSLCGGFL